MWAMRDTRDRRPTPERPTSRCLYSVVQTHSEGRKSDSVQRKRQLTAGGGEGGGQEKLRAASRFTPSRTTPPSAQGLYMRLFSRLFFMFFSFSFSFSISFHVFLFFICFCQDQLNFPAMQVTSCHVSIWCHLLASYDEYTALVKFGNVASEHVK